MLMYREQIPRQVDVRIPLEIILPPGLSPEAKALRQLPENRSEEDNQLVQVCSDEISGFPSYFSALYFLLEFVLENKIFPKKIPVTPQKNRKLK